MNGIININKPVGMTSHDVVSFARKCLGIKKIGHTGTLDPDASGVLPICIGRATRVAGDITAGEKKYVTVMKLGITTDTQDSTGNILEEKNVDISEEIIRNTIKSFIGSIEQIPPMYSAIKVNGQKLYELARKGIEVKREPRRIDIFGIDIRDINLSNSTVTMEVHCSKGTYIRSLCHDIGNMMGCGGHMASLVRTRSGIFYIEEAVELGELKRFSAEGRIQELIIPIDKIYSDLPSIIVNDEGEKKLVNGNEVSVSMVRNFIPNKDISKYRVYNKNGLFLSISETTNKEDGRLVFKLIKGFY
jgi:tRNA pseudouridine55 synthase